MGIISTVEAEVEKVAEEVVSLVTPAKAMNAFDVTMGWLEDYLVGHPLEQTALAYFQSIVDKLAPAELDNLHAQLQAMLTPPAPATAPATAAPAAKK